MIGRLVPSPARCPPSIRSSGRPTTSPRTSSSSRSLELVTLDRDDDQSYLFKHVVTQEVAYGSLPYAIRAVLHERDRRATSSATEADAIEPQLDLLAHHFWHSDDEREEARVPGPRR